MGLLYLASTLVRQSPEFHEQSAHTKLPQLAGATGRDVSTPSVSMASVAKDSIGEIRPRRAHSHCVYGEQRTDGEHCQLIGFLDGGLFNLKKVINKNLKLQEERATVSLEL
jgi:hypothetical protein